VATPESCGLSSQALRALAETVEDYIDRDMAVGAELLVIKDRQTVLHEAFGWRDREGQVPMEPDTLFNIRSMTKPITGAAIQILVDEGRLALDDRASDYLPGFDVDDSRDITIEQLLTHRSGLPLSTLQGTRDYESLYAMANAIGQGGPQFPPGSTFWYSDAGADVLGAIVEQVSGSSLDEFVTQRLLEPLGMADTAYLGTPDDPRLDRVATLYVGGVGNWQPFWTPADEPFYPFAWGSQSLYGTPADYARFLAMWMDEGRVGDAPVLTPEAVARTLEPVERMKSLGSDSPYPTRFADLAAYHGQMALLHLQEASVDEDRPQGADPVIVGYSGSDGTIAWAWPDRDLMILYFTQSRGGATAIRLEEEIERLLLDPAPEGRSPTPSEYADYLGTYTADFGPFVNQPFEVLWRDGSLALDIPSQFIYALDRAGPAERWTMREDPEVGISFVRDSTGVVTGMQINQGGNRFELPRGTAGTAPEEVLSPEQAAPYLGWYRDAQTGREVEVVLQAGRLALRIPETNEPLPLHPPDADGSWRLRMDPTISLRFDLEAGRAVSYRVRGPAGEAVFTRMDRDER
jgi:CubicO group peptidase (beta-lactamase class C family)